MGLHARIVVTGGAGFIGSAVTRRLIADGVGVLCVDKLTYAGSLDTLTQALDAPNLEFVQADICDAPRMRELFATFQPDAVLHLAAESHVDRSIDGPGAFVQTNVTGTFAMLEAARGHWQALERDARDRFRFVHISTDEVFGSLGPTGFFSEETPYRPSSPYSATKAASDHLVRAWQHTYGLPTLITNCSNNYGPYQFPDKLIPLTIGNALQGLPLPVYGPGEHVRDWLYVEDHVSALLRVLEAGVPGETYAVGGHNEHRNIDIVRRICALLDEVVPLPGVPDRTALIRFVTDRPGHDQRYAIDAAKIERELGWTPTETFETGLRRTVRWYLDHPDWLEGTHARGYEGERLGLSAAGTGA